ncbi:MAG: hypothetical protein LBH62_01490 [Nitrososphaerota archaeon]|jgi:hypothetical protein|nr:hypothetical protein [Nitrososphaerota archaeon]
MLKRKSMFAGGQRMVKDTNKHLILIFAIFVFAFLYRFLLMTHATFPPGADIGLHNSIIHSIINQGSNVDFLYNYYQMGGGLSLTFPGYHLFTAQIIMLTGVPEYLVHAIVVSLFSSITVLVSYLITRAVWKESAAIIVAFLMAISRFDIEMLCWGGYPNVITLMLIPVTFYLYIQKKRFTKLPFYISTSLLISSIFIVHSLSIIVFVSILFSMIFFSLIFGSKLGTTRFEALSWLLPVISAGLITLPYLIKVVPAFLTNSTNAEINLATASARVLPLELVLPLFVVVGLYFILSKKYHKRYFTIPTLLLVLWILVPAVFTQGYLIGQYTDFHRFLYFVMLPVIMLISLFIDFGSSFFARVIDTYRSSTSQLNSTTATIKETEPVTPKRLTSFSKKANRTLTRANLYAGFLIGFLVICFFIPLFAAPQEGLKQQTFYQIMNDPLYQGMDWAKVNTSDNAVVVTEAYYGWWFAGFAQRPTWSAVVPYFLSLSREVPIAQTATNLLDNDYLFESSFKLSDEVHGIQVREDGGYMARHNPQIFACLNWTYSPYPFFNFNNNQTKIMYEVNGVPQSITLDKLPVLAMCMENSSQYTAVSVVKGNEYFTCTQFTVVYAGSKFVNITYTLEAVSKDVSLSWLQSTLEVNALPVGTERSNSLGFLAKNVKVFGQVVFNKNIPYINSKSYNSAYTEVRFDYNLEGKKQSELQMSLTTYSATNNQALYDREDKTLLNAFFDKQIDINLQPENRDNLPLPAPFNYQAELKINNIEYIAVTRSYMADSNADVRLKFANDPLFNLVFINPEVAIFEVKK